MVGMEFFNTIYMCPLIITISRERIDKSIYLPYFRNVFRYEVSLRVRRADKECSIFQKKSDHTILTYSTISDISISDIHRILGEYTISHSKSDFLISDKEP